MRKWVFAVFTFVWMLGASNAMAWSEPYHRIIAEAAYGRLTPKVKAEVDRLIASDALTPAGGCPIKSFSDASVWPDCVRGDPVFKYMSPWHYDNAPACGAVQREEYCAKGACASAAIERARRTLRDASKSDQDRLGALAQLAHFIADIHQPLHAIDSHRGGNDVPVTYLGKASYTNSKGEVRFLNLHGVWDYNIPGAAVDADPAVAVLGLQNLAGANVKEWSTGGAREWVGESNGLAVQYSYGQLGEGLACKPAPAVATPITEPYVDVAAPVVKVQMAKAAVRLAFVLNQSLK